MLQRTRVPQAAFNGSLQVRAFIPGKVTSDPVDCFRGAPGCPERVRIRLGEVEMLKQETSADSAEQRSFDNPAEIQVASCEER